MSGWNASLSPQDSLARAFDAALGLLARRIAEPDFPAAIRTAFGDEADRKSIADALSDILIERSGPRLGLVAGETLGGARGAYDANSDTIYLSETFVAAASSPAAIGRVLLEEIGHAVDARLGARLGVADAPGDEGSLFAALVLGEDVGPAACAAIRAEDDHATVVIGGAETRVEFAADYGTVGLDGALAEWSAADRLDTPASGAPGYALYAKHTGGAFVFAIEAPVAIGAGTTIWLNTDQSKATGHQIWGFAGGAEFNVDFDAAGVPHLYSGDSGQTLVAGPLDHAYSADRMRVEFAVPGALLPGDPQAVDVLADVNDNTFLPNDYSSFT